MCPRKEAQKEGPKTMEKHHLENSFWAAELALIK